MDNALKPWLRLPVIASLYPMARLLRNILQFNPGEDEWGFCNICGYYSCFTYHELIPPSSRFAESCEWDPYFTKIINVCNTMSCAWCLSKFRVRSATDVLLKTFKSNQYSCLNDLVKDLMQTPGTWRALETGSTGGIFSQLKSLKAITKTEYFNSIPRGTCIDGVFSEDLQELSFPDNSFNIVISLDVFEHIANPWRAFAEVYRVLRPQGTAIITIPIDWRLTKTKARAQMEGDSIQHVSPPAYHLDPLRTEGALVFTDFGQDLIQCLNDLNIPGQFKSYRTQKRKIEQFVLVIEKI